MKTKIAIVRTTCFVTEKLSDEAPKENPIWPTSSEYLPEIANEFLRKQNSDIERYYRKHLYGEWVAEEPEPTDYKLINN